MKVYIDADACPVTDIVIAKCAAKGIPCVLVCDTAHQIRRPGADTVTVDKGSDSADLMIANKVRPGDIVVTQDYGLACICLGRNARILHQDGWEYTPFNIDALMFQRHENRRLRAAGIRGKGPSKRTKAQDQAFSEALEKLLQGYSAGGSR